MLVVIRVIPLQYIAYSECCHVREGTRIMAHVIKLRKTKRRDVIEHVMLTQSDGARCYSCYSVAIHRVTLLLKSASTEELNQQR